MALSSGAIAAIHAAVGTLFGRVKRRYLGTDSGSKKMMISNKPSLTLPALYAGAATEDGSKPKTKTAKSLVEIATGYLDASEASTKAKVVHAVNAFLRDAETKGETPNASVVLGGELSKIWGTVTTDVKRILETEATHARNIGTLEGIIRVAAARGIEDPIVCWVGPNDEHTCAECRRLYLMPDRVTPRVWKLSEASHAYHHRGEENPKIGGLHPNCRHTMAVLMPGFGFKAGKIEYIGPDHDELTKQRGG